MTHQMPTKNPPFTQRRMRCNSHLQRHGRHYCDEATRADLEVTTLPIGQAAHYLRDDESGR